MKLRNQYKWLTLLLVILFLAGAVLGLMNTGNMNSIGSAFWFFGIMSSICIVFSALAFFVTIPKEDFYEFKNSNTKEVAQVNNLAQGLPVSGVGNGFSVGPRARYIWPVIIINAITVLAGIEFVFEHPSLLFLLFILSLITELIAIYAGIICHKYNSNK